MRAGAKLALLAAAAAAAAAVTVLALGCCRGKPPEPGVAPDRKRAWAEPVKLAGVDNCFKVSDALYRGRQPTPEGFLELKKLGIRTVINLRAFHSDADEIKDSGVEGFKTVHISFKTWHAEDQDVVRFLKTVGDPANSPVFVHCMHGSDRTGLMCAIYRAVVQGWSKDQALEEMTKGPYGFHSVWKNLPEYFKALDVEKLRKETGITLP
jgi:protein tyrosine/serine phosphatase